MFTATGQLLWRANTVLTLPAEEALDDTILQGMKREDAAPPTFAQEIWQVCQEFLEGFQFSIDCNSKGQKNAGRGVNPCASVLTRNGSQDGIDEFPGR